jgi:hypothetical protein
MTTTREGKGSALTHPELDANFAPRVTQATHGFVVGNVVSKSGGTWVKAQATADSTMADGIVVAVSGTDDFWVRIAPGEVAIASHGLGTGGEVVYLSQSTAGALTATNPGSGRIQRCGRVLDSGTVLFRVGNTWEVL